MKGFRIDGFDFLQVREGCPRGGRLETPETIPVIRNILCRDLQVAKAIARRLMQEGTVWVFRDFFNIVEPERGLRMEYLLILNFVM